MSVAGNTEKPMTEPACMVWGGANVDVIATADDMVTVGDSVPGRVQRGFGGVGRNIAENLARLQVSVQLASALGNDADGDALLAQAQGAGIQTDCVIQMDAGSTARYIAIVDAAGELQLAVSDMAIFDSQSVESVAAGLDALPQHDSCVVDANLPAAIIQAIAERLDRQWLVCDAVSQYKFERLLPLLSRIDLLKVNALEAIATLRSCGVQMADNSKREDLCEQLLQQGVAAILLSCGAEGFYYADSTEQRELAASPTELVNTNGAGDAALAALLAARLHGHELTTQLRWAANAAALTCASHHAVNPELTISMLTCDQ